MPALTAASALPEQAAASALQTKNSRLKKVFLFFDQIR
jgi:hypothetical protein